MKKSNLYLSILSALIISACGSSSSNDNQSVDPTPNTTPTHNQNQNTNTNPKPTKPQSPAANPNPESVTQNQSTNQIQNNQPINSKKAPAIKAKPTTSHKGNGQGGKGQGATNNTTIKTPDFNTDGKSKTELEKLLAQATSDKATAQAKETAANSKVVAISGDLSAAKGDLDTLANDIINLEKNIKNPSLAVQKAQNEGELAAKLDAFKQKEEEIKKLASDLTSAKQEEANQNALKDIAQKSADVYQAALDTKKAEEVDPEPVVALKKAEEEEAKLTAKKQAADEEEAIATAKVAAVEEEIKALEEANKANKELAESPDTSAEVKEAAKDRIKSNDEKIAELNKEKAENKKAETDAKKKAADINVDLGNASTKVTEVGKDAEYRGVYASTGTYDESTSYKNVNKVTATNGTNASLWMRDWVLSIKDGDKEVTLKLNDIKSKGELTTPALKASNKSYAYFDKDEKILASGGVYSIQGYVGDNFFNAGKVTPINATKLKSGKINFNSSHETANKAFLKTTDGKNVMAVVSAAEANFDTKKFTGQFDTFKEYSLDFNGKVEDTILPSPFPTSVNFEADIKGNKFVPVEKNPNPNAAKVYGYFYGPGANEAGGLVEYDKFNGTFSVRQ